MDNTFYFNDLLEQWHAEDVINEALLGDICVSNRVAHTITCVNELAYETIGRLLAADAWDTADTAEEPQDEFIEEVVVREDQFRNDVEADADALSSAGMGTDEDYEHDSGGFDEEPE